jgi:ADP-heptose:LPS heptosyltransferase
VDSSYKRIAVLRALNLGDMLCAVPALRALRRAFPGAEITLLGLPWAREFAHRYGKYVDRFVHMPGYYGFPEQTFRRDQLDSFLEQSREYSYDLAIQMHGDGTHANDLMVQLGAAHIAGFYPATESQPESKLFVRYPEDLPEPMRHLRLMEHIGAPSDGGRLEFPLFSEDLQELGRLGGELPWVDYAVIHPGSGNECRRWRTQHFAEVADGLAESGLTVVLTGSAAERPLVAEVFRAMRYDALDLSGRTSLGAMGALVSRAAITVCNDTGISHLAAAFGTPSLVIGRRDQSLRWAPLDSERHRYLCNEAAAPVLPDHMVAEAATLLDQFAKVAA